MTRELKNLISVSCLAIICLSACKSGGGKREADTKKATPPPARVDAFIVAPQAISQDIEVPGSLTPFEETQLFSEVAGRVTGLYFKEGTTVGKGALLVKLYDADLQAQVKKLQVQLAIARKTEERQSELLKIGGISQQDYDLSLLSVNTIIADIAIVRSNIARTEIRAPFSGTLGLRNISIGAYVTPATLISTLRQVNQLKLEFTVPERYGNNMTPGSLINFVIDGSDKKYSAKVIANENDIAEETRSLRVRAVVDQKDNSLIAGAFAKVQITLGKDEAALMIPTQAIIPQARSKKVLALRNGVTSMETVTTGIRDSSMVEITSGLKQGDTILLTGLLSTKPGSKVQVKIIGNK